MSAAEIKRGYLMRVKPGIRIGARKKWVKLIEEGVNRELRLEIFVTEKAARDGEFAKEIIRLEDAKLAIRTTKHKHAFIIELNSESSERETLMFASDSDTDADDWVDAVNRLLMQNRCSNRWREPETFVAQVPDATKLPKLEDGKYYVTPTVYHDRLHCRPGEVCVMKVTPDKLILYGESGRDILVEWNLAALRRYGNTSEYFQFEAGRRTTTGEGVFTMMTKYGQVVYDLVHHYTQELVRRSRASGNTASPTQARNSLQRTMSAHGNSSAPSSRPNEVQRSPSLNSSTPQPPMPGGGAARLPAATNGGQSTYEPINPASLTPSVYESTGVQSGRQASTNASDTYMGLTALTADQPPTYMDVLAQDRARLTAAQQTVPAAVQNMYQPLGPNGVMPAASNTAQDTYQPIGATQTNVYEGITPATREAPEQSTYQALQK